MEKRKPTFEKYDPEKYGRISYNFDPIIGQTTEYVSISVLGLIIKKEKSNPDKYLIVYAPELDNVFKNVFKSAMKYHNTIEPGCVYAVDSTELKGILEGMRRVYCDVNESDHISFGFAVNDTYEFITNATFVSEVEGLDEEKTDTLLDVLESLEDNAPSGVEQTSYGTKLKVSYEAYDAVYAHAVSHDEFPILTVYKQQGVYSVELSIDGIYMLTLVEVENDVKVHICYFTYDSVDPDDELECEKAPFVRYFQDDFEPNTLYGISYSVFKDELLPELVSSYTNYYAEHIAGVLESYKDIIEHYAPLITKQWEV